MKTLQNSNIILLILLTLCFSVGWDQILPTHQTTENTLPDISITHQILVFSESAEQAKHPALLLHELPELNTKTIEFAVSLARDFTVYVPPLFSSRNQNSIVLGRLSYIFNGEWWERDELIGSRQITKWLGHVVENISQAHDPKQKIGIIGICITRAPSLSLTRQRESPCCRCRIAYIATRLVTGRQV